jgi:hypothetical protein
LEETKDFLLSYLKSGGISMMKTFLSTQIKEIMKKSSSVLKDKIAGGTLFKEYENSIIGEINEEQDIE